ncbi:MAG: CvpA family protein [Anaerolineales bacterium]
MMSLHVAFLMYCGVFGIVGGMRGWAKEILVLFSMVLALFLNTIIVQFVPGVDTTLAAQAPRAQFFVRAAFFVLLAFFGYESPAISSVLGGKARRERLQDTLLGVVLGLVNGYLLIGTLWHYLDVAQYPMLGIIPPEEGSVAANYLNFLPPRVIGVPHIYFAVGLAFVFVIVVFI